MDAFDDVFAAHHHRLLRLAGLIIGDGAVAEDVVSEAFARTYPKWRRGRIEDVGAYLRRAVVNECNGVFRKRRRRWLPSVAVVDSHEAAVVEHERVWHAMLDLSVRQRSILVLRFWDGLSEAETARTLGIPVGTVKSSTSRAMAKLRVVLTEEAEHEHT